MDIDLALLAGASRVFVIVAALIALGWALRRMRRESAEQLDAVAGRAAEDARTEIQTLAEKVSALATLVAAMPARVERRSRRRDPHRAANRRRCAATKPRAAWRAPAPPSKRSSRPAASPAQRRAYSNACTVLRRWTAKPPHEEVHVTCCEARLPQPEAPAGRNRR